MTTSLSLAPLPITSSLHKLNAWNTHLPHNFSVFRPHASYQLYMATYRNYKVLVMRRRKRSIKFWGFTSQTHGLIMRHAVAGNFRLIFTTLGFFNIVHLNLSTRAFLHFVPIEMWLPWLGSSPRPQTQHCNAQQWPLSYCGGYFGGSDTPSGYRQGSVTLQTRTQAHFH